MEQGKQNMLANEVRSARSRIIQCLEGKYLDLDYINDTLSNVIIELETEENHIQGYKDGQQDLLKQIINKTDWSNGEILEFVNKKLIDS